MKTKKYNILDLLKFILSIMVVAIHTDLFPALLYPWLRIAIPLFFVISAFLLFSKINNSPKEKWNIIKKYVLKQLKFYLFWCVVLIPVTIIVRTVWFSDGIINGIIKTVAQIIFSSTFIGSWYIVAQITSVLIVAKISEKLNNKIMFVIFFVIYLGCLLSSSYSLIGNNIPIFNELKKIFIVSPIYSFPVALIYIFIGKLFADEKIIYSKEKITLHFVFTIIFSVLLYFEWRYIVKFTGILNYDCYFFLLPLIISIFALVLNININLKNAKLLCKISIITYPLHGSVAFCVNIYFKSLGINENIIGVCAFIVTLCICYIVCYIILKLQKVKGFEIFKYSNM